MAALSGKNAVAELGGQRGIGAVVRVGFELFGFGVFS